MFISFLLYILIFIFILFIYHQALCTPDDDQFPCAGLANRAVGSTAMNLESSRSHEVFSLQYIYVCMYVHIHIYIYICIYIHK